MVRVVEVILKPGEKMDLPTSCSASRSQSPEMRPSSWLSRRGGPGKLHHSGERQRHSATTMHKHGMPSGKTTTAKMLKWLYNKGSRLDKKINRKAKKYLMWMISMPYCAWLGNL
jgi:hypothetical protein